MYPYIPNMSRSYMYVVELNAQLLSSLVTSVSRLGQSLLHCGG